MRHAIATSLLQLLAMTNHLLGEVRHAIGTPFDFARGTLRVTGAGLVAMTSVLSLRATLSRSDLGASDPLDR